MKFELRRATLADHELLASMNKALIEDEGSTNGLSLQDLTRRMYRMLSEDWTAVLIETGGQVIGYALFQQRSAEPVEIYLRQYFIHRNFRSKGYGQAAFERIQAEYFPPGASVALDVLASNPRGRHFWEKLGFASHAEMMRLEKHDVLQEQIAYYQARAGEYDEWFYRLGRYDRGPELNQQWFDEVKQVMERLHSIGPLGETLELACGTGIWTEQLLRISQHVTALDASPEVIAVNRDKLKSDKVDYQQADLFNWTPERQYDLVFFSFWLSHVPPDRLDAFLAQVAAATRPGGQVFIVDSRRIATSTAIDHAPYDPEDIHHVRKLNDGREFTIYKIFYEPNSLRAKLAEFGFEAEAQFSPNYFIYAHGRRTDSA